MRWLNMYIYQLTYEDEGSLLMIGYFGSWKKARSVMKKYRSTLPGFKEYPNCFIIKKMKVNKDQTVDKLGAGIIPAPFFL